MLVRATALPAGATAGRVGRRGAGVDLVDPGVRQASVALGGSAAGRSWRHRSTSGRWRGAPTCGPRSRPSWCRRRESRTTRCRPSAGSARQRPAHCRARRRRATRARRACRGRGCRPSGPRCRAAQRVHGCRARAAVRGAAADGDAAPGSRLGRRGGAGDLGRAGPQLGVRCGSSGVRPKDGQVRARDRRLDGVRARCGVRTCAAECGGERHGARHQQTAGAARHPDAGFEGRFRTGFIGHIARSIRVRKRDRCYIWDQSGESRKWDDKPYWPTCDVAFTPGRP